MCNTTNTIKKNVIFPHLYFFHLRHFLQCALKQLALVIDVRSSPQKTSFFFLFSSCGNFDILSLERQTKNIKLLKCGTFQMRVFKMFESLTLGSKWLMFEQKWPRLFCLFPQLVLNAIKWDAAASLQRRRLNSVNAKAPAAAASEALQHKSLPSSREVVNKSRRHA